MRIFQPTPFRAVMTAAALVAVTVAASCETAPRHEEPAEPAGPTPEARFEEPIDPTGMDAAELLPPAGAGAIAYRVIEGDQAGETVHIEPNGDTAEDGWRRERPDGRIEHLGIDAEGNLVLTAIEDPGHNALTRYNPPMMVLPVDLAPGESRTYQYELRVYYLDDPERQRESGRSEMTVAHEADQPITTADGRTLQAHRISSRSTSRVGLARLESAGDAWFAPGAGLVAQDFRETLRALIVNRAESWRLVLADDIGR